MSRISSQLETEQLEKKLSDMEERLSKGKGRFFSCFNCLVYMFVLILVIGGYGAYWGAKSGLVDVPMLSDKLYQEPKPDYLVTSEKFLSATEILKSLLAGAAKQFAQGKEVATVDLNITEGQLTSLLQNTLNTQEKNYSLAQVSIHDGILDMYIKTDKGLVVNIIATPIFDNGKLKFKTESVKIGNAPLPKFVSSIALSMSIGGAVNTMQKTLSALGSLQGVYIEGVTMRMTILLSNKASFLNNVLQ